MAGIYLSRELGWTKSRVETSLYSDPRSRLSVGDAKKTLTLLWYLLSYYVYYRVGKQYLYSI